MSYLLDTHFLLWSWLSPSLLSPHVKAIFRDPKPDILVSVVSFWKISFKYALGALHLDGLSPADFVGAVADVLSVV